MENNFLYLGMGWGLSDKPGYKNMYLNKDGLFTIREVYVRPRDQKDNTEKQGKIDEDRMVVIKKFLDENIIENFETMITDASWKIEYMKGDRKIIVSNNLELWKRLAELIPEFSDK